MDPQLFKDTIEPLMANTTVVHGCKQSVALTISINDTTHEHVEMSLTYSRPAFTHKPDPLYRPDRSKEEAKIIPPELFDEIRALPHPFTPLFESVFDVENMPRDHLNHWLMRSIQVPEKDLLKVAESDRGKENKILIYRHSLNGEKQSFSWEMLFMLPLYLQEMVQTRPFSTEWN